MPKMRAPQSPFLLISTLLLSFILFAAANSAAIATAVAADTATETSTEHSDADDDDESSSPPTPEDDDEGFHMVELVHMHDPRIPGNENLNLDKYEALRERVLTSVAKRHHDSHHKINKKKKKKTDWSSPGMIQMVMKTGFDYLSSEYFVQVRVGTPSQNFWLVADTGSELTWFRCNDDHTNETKTELESHGHNRRSALRVNGRREFYRRLSSTYKKVTCGDPRCASPEFLNMCSLPECELPTDLCPYEYSYVDTTVVSGYFGTDVITPGIKDKKKGKLYDFVVGCTKDIRKDNGTAPFNNKTDGVMGLNYEPNSFMFKATKQFGNKFSYCLMDHTLHKSATNFLTFGQYSTSQTGKANLLGPMQHIDLDLRGGYGVRLTGVSVGGKIIPVPPDVWEYKEDDGNSGTTMDSGSALTFICHAAFPLVSEALFSPLVTKFPKYPHKVDPFTCCVTAKREEITEAIVPKLGFHFANGVSYFPPLRNYVIEVLSDVHCIGVVQDIGPGGTGTIIGNLMQQEHLWEYDLEKLSLGFAPSKCQ